MALLVLASAGFAQSTDSKPPADAWMKEPTPYLAWNNGISPELRAARNRFWDDASMSDIPLTQEGSLRVSGGSYDMTWDSSEISDRLPNRTIVTATFTNHRSVLSTSERSLYSEVTFRVDKVYEDNTGKEEPLAGRDITLIVYGGTVVLKDGKDFSVNAVMISPDGFIQPDRKYLLALSYDKDGDFFEYGDSWDMTDGTLRATSGRAEYFVQDGHSALNGIKVEQLDAVMAKQLHKDQPQNGASKGDGADASSPSR
ncbi:MAG TPA: hypothetical protein VK976_02415 [Verrucomicrobiae bacterium]|jgi:hypothetical protein|nr:hypothetical protein [Verrucomicrobiae bacterium]